jgi:putative phosphoribosyl transferase
MVPKAAPTEHEVQVAAGGVILPGTLTIPPGARGLIVFAHGSGSSRHSPRNRYVAGVLQQAGLATLLFDLLTAEEEKVDVHTAHLRFDIPLLAARVAGASAWLRQQPEVAALPLGYFGASTGAAAALLAAAEQPGRVAAIVSRGGRPDLARRQLPQVQAPTLLLVGEKDLPVLELNRQAYELLGSAEKQLVVLPGASHLFEEPGALEEVARLARDWFCRYLTPPSSNPAGIH